MQHKYKKYNKYIKKNLQNKSLLNKLKVLIVIGTRPEVIKMLPVICELKNKKKYFETRLCVTGQHKEMLYQTLDQFKIIPDLDLRLMKKDQELHLLTSKIILGLQNELKKKRPDIVLVQGDTTTAMATSIACFYYRIIVGHIEAGLRTNNVLAPFPEEFNRRVVTLCSDIHFAPTKEAKLNLKKEGINKDKIIMTGNTVIDALLNTISYIESDKKLNKSIIDYISKTLDFEWKKSQFVLITLHRRENFGKSLAQICKALVALAKDYPLINFVYPVHLNPNVLGPVHELLSGYSNIYLVKPYGYQHFCILLKHAYIILTDSGGIQEEAPSLGKPVLVMRDETERPEGIKAGTAKLISCNNEKIYKSVSELLNNKRVYKKMSNAHNPYGDGKAAGRIIIELEKLLIQPSAKNYD